MTQIYLASIPDKLQSNALSFYYNKPRKPSVLISYAYLKGWIRTQKTLGLPDIPQGFNFFLDSGAFTANNSGKTINIDQLVEETKNPRWAESAGLDVIGSPQATLKNILYMRAHGSPAIPTFHIGEPWEFLIEYKKQFKKIALGGLVPIKSKIEKQKWLDEVFARCWPHQFHAFGMTSEPLLMRFPFHSADSSSWQSGPGGRGRWACMGGANMGLNRPKIRERNVTLIPEVEHYLRMENRVQARWADEFKKQGWVK